MRALLGILISFSLLQFPAHSQTPIGGGELGVSVADVQASHTEIFEALFQTPYDANTAAWELDQQVTGEGSYTGVNEHGQPFQLDVQTYVSVDWTTLALTPQDAQDLANRNAQFCGIVATLSTDLASYDVWGTVAFQSNRGVPFQSRLLLGHEVESRIETAASTSVVTVPVLIPILCNPDDCAAGCHTDYDADVQAIADDAFENDPSVQAAQAALEQAEITNAAIRDSRVQDAESQLAADLLVATTSATISHIACGVTALFSGPVGVGCIVLAQAQYTYEVASAVVNRNAEITQAEAEYETAMQEARQDVLDAIEDARQAALAQAWDDYMECLDGCDVLPICGYDILWITVETHD